MHASCCNLSCVLMFESICAGARQLWDRQLPDGCRGDPGRRPAAAGGRDRRNHNSAQLQGANFSKEFAIILHSFGVPWRNVIGAGQHRLPAWRQQSPLTDSQGSHNINAGTVWPAQSSYMLGEPVGGHSGFLKMKSQFKFHNSFLFLRSHHICWRSWFSVTSPTAAFPRQRGWRQET